MNLNIKTTRKILDYFKVKTPLIKPRFINLVADATFFRKRKDKDGLLIFLDSITSTVVWHKFIRGETKPEYQEGLDYLLKLGFVINCISCHLDNSKTKFTTLYRHLW